MSQPKTRIGAAAAEDFARALGAAERPVVVVGAGMSVASGIAPYRKGPDAVWSRFHTEWGTKEMLETRTVAWWRDFWGKAHPESILDKEPNLGHHALAQMTTLLPSLLTITQNVDGLHAKAGHPSKQLIEIHGRHGLYRCNEPNCDRFIEPYTEVDLSGLDVGEVPACEECGSMVRPLVLLFDERYYSHPFFDAFRAMRALDAADCLLFIGTSFAVGITANALAAGRANRARMLNVNVEPFDDLETIIGPSEEVLPQVLVALQAAR